MDIQSSYLKDGFFGDIPLNKAENLRNIQGKIMTIAGR
jgi:hypothetical protein